MYIGARKYTTYNTFINICAYLLVSIFLIKEINLIYFLLSFVVLMIFYIFNSLILSNKKHFSISKFNWKNIKFVHIHFTLLNYGPYIRFHWRTHFLLEKKWSPCLLARQRNIKRRTFHREPVGKIISGISRT